MVAYPIPRVAVGHSIPIVIVDDGASLLAIMSSFVFDYVLRQKLGGVNLTYNYLQQLPVPPKAWLRLSAWGGKDSLDSWIVRRVAELVYTATDMAGFATDYGLGAKPTFSLGSI